MRKGMNMKNKLIASILTLALLTGALAGCSGDASEAPASSAPESSAASVAESAPGIASEPESASEAETDTRTITDMAGREVVLPKEVKTIATFGSIGVLNAFVELMGAGDRICNDMSPSFTKNDKWAMQYEFAPQIKGAPVLENADREVQIEDVLATKPDLCLTMTTATADYLAENGLTVVYLAWSELDDVKVAVELMGEILGTQDIAGEYIAYFDETVARAAELTASLGEGERRRAVYGNVVEYSQPHKIAEWWIGVAGGVSVTEEAHTEESLTYTAEDLLLWDPEVMFVTASQTEDLKANEQLAGIAAVRNDAIHLVPTVAHTWGNRTVEQPLTILWALNKMYPELYTEQELAKDIRSFYSRFFHYDMSDDQIAAIIG